MFLSSYNLDVWIEKYDWIWRRQLELWTWWPCKFIALPLNQKCWKYILSSKFNLQNCYINVCNWWTKMKMNLLQALWSRVCGLWDAELKVNISIIQWVTYQRSEALPALPYHFRRPSSHTSTSNRADKSLSVEVRFSPETTSEPSLRSPSFIRART